MFDRVDTYILFGKQNRQYFTGISTSFGCVIISQSEKVFITDFRYELAAMTGLKDFTVVITTFADLYDNIRQQLSRLGSKAVGFEDDVLTFREHKELKEALGGYTLKAAGSDILEQRACKSAKEIEYISKAQDIAQKALAKVRTYFKTDITERDIAAELLFEMLKNGAQEASFNTIVAFGDNAAKPHHIPSDRKLAKGDCVLIDFGARYNGYCSDMTRTFFYGEPSKKMASVYNIVLEAQKYVLANIKSGMTGHEADSFAREYIISNGYDKEFGHSLGHGVGLDIHEAPRLSRNSKDILLPGMIVTIEPGIYIPDIGGVRIEDMAVVTENGLLNLTTFEKENI